MEEREAPAQTGRQVTKSAKIIKQKRAQQAREPARICEVTHGRILIGREDPPNPLDPLSTGEGIYANVGDIIELTGHDAELFERQGVVKRVS